MYDYGGVIVTDSEGERWQWAIFRDREGETITAMFAAGMDDEDRAWSVPVDTEPTEENLRAAVAAFFAKYHPTESEDHSWDN